MNLTARHLKPYSARCVLYVLLVVLSVMFTMATALSVADFLKILFGSESSEVPAGGNLVAQWLEGLYGWLISFGQLNALLLFSGIVFVLYGLKNVFGYFSVVEIASIRVAVVRDLRNEMFRKAMRLPMRYYDRNRKGDVLSRFSSDMVEYEENILNSVQQLLSSVVSMLLFLAMLFYLNLKLTLFVLCMLPVVAVVISGISRKLKQKSKTVQEMNSYLISLTDETMAGLKIIKGYTAIDFSNERFRKYNRQYSKLRTSMFSRIYSASPISEFLGNVVVVGILLFGAYLVMRGDNGLTAELFISYVMMFVLMIPPANELSSAISQMKKGKACADRIEAFLSQDEEVGIEDAGTPSSADTVTDTAVALQHVSFSYNPGVQVLHDVSIDVPRGTTLALVGSSGSGKSTIADLICRFYEVTEGKILFNGVPLQDMSLERLRSRIGVVSQDTLLFNDTVEANIAFGCDGATHEQVQAAAQAAQAHDFIMQLPQGYNTNIGEGGGSLSGGQRQRISIARALLRDPELLILDEATSALDTESERLLQQTLDTVLEGRTAIVIAHRLSTVVNADRIVVLDAGRVVESGTHHELLARGGRYSELVALQSFA